MTASTKIQRDVCGNTDLYKVCCDNYRHFTYMIDIDLFYLTPLWSFLGCFFECLTLFIP